MGIWIEVHCDGCDHLNANGEPNYNCEDSLYAREGYYAKHTIKSVIEIKKFAEFHAFKSGYKRTKLGLLCPSCVEFWGKQLE